LRFRTAHGQSTGGYYACNRYDASKVTKDTSESQAKVGRTRALPRVVLVSRCNGSGTGHGGVPAVGVRRSWTATYSTSSATRTTTRCGFIACVVSCRVVSCRVVSCRVVSCRVVSCRVVSCRVVSCRVVSCRVVSCCVLACWACQYETAVSLSMDCARVAGEQVRVQTAGNRAEAHHGVPGSERGTDVVRPHVPGERSGVLVGGASARLLSL
jgi:hypothetical protein